MKRSDDVFLFTLIDFLLQALFFGLFLYVVTKALAPKPLATSETKAREALLEKTKVSTLSELTDLLTRLAPLEQLAGTAEFFEKNGGEKGVRNAVDAAKAAGGADKIRSLQNAIHTRDQEIEGLKTEMRAWGTPSCIYETVAGKVRPKAVARVRVSDDRIELDSPTPEMEAIFSSLHLQYNAVQTLSHSAFRQAFAPLLAQKPNCRYFLEVTAKPTLYTSMQVVWSAFRTQ